MDIKEECPIDIPTSHLAKMCLVPTEIDLNIYDRLLKKQARGCTEPIVIVIMFLENNLGS
jgi:hypothetical protein